MYTDYIQCGDIKGKLFLNSLVGAGSKRHFNCNEAIIPACSESSGGQKHSRHKSGLAVPFKTAPLNDTSEAGVKMVQQTFFSDENNLTC